jgi:hypothetical protein
MVNSAGFEALCLKQGTHSFRSAVFLIIFYGIYFGMLHQFLNQGFYHELQRMLRLLLGLTLHHKSWFILKTGILGKYCLEKGL